jgi:hypothetical protein
MKYVPKEPPKLGLIADADATMREFNRAMGVVYNDIDQNNVSNKAVSWQRIASPVNDHSVSTSVLGTVNPVGTGNLYLATQDSGYAQTLSGPAEQSTGSRERRSEGYFWEFVSVNSTSKDLILSVTLSTETELTVIGTGQLYREGTAFTPTATIMFDVRLYSNGSSLGLSETVSSRVLQPDLPFYVSCRKPFQPGTHDIRIQVRDRSSALDDSHAALTGVSRIQRTAICLFGFCR